MGYRVRLVFRLVNDFSGLKVAIADTYPDVEGMHIWKLLRPILLLTLIQSSMRHGFKSDTALLRSTKLAGTCVVCQTFCLGVDDLDSLKSQMQTKNGPFDNNSI